MKFLERECPAIVVTRDGSACEFRTVLGNLPQIAFGHAEEHGRLDCRKLAETLPVFRRVFERNDLLLGNLADIGPVAKAFFQARKFHIPAPCGALSAKNRAIVAKLRRRRVNIDVLPITRQISMVKDLLRVPQMTTHGRWRRIGRFRRGSSRGAFAANGRNPFPALPPEPLLGRCYEACWLAIAVGCASSVPGVLEGCFRFGSVNIVRMRSGGSRPTITSCLTSHLDRRSREPDSVNGYDQSSSVVAAIDLVARIGWLEPAAGWGRRLSPVP